MSWVSWLGAVKTLSQNKVVQNKQTSFGKKKKKRRWILVPSPSLSRSFSSSRSSLIFRYLLNFQKHIYWNLCRIIYYIIYNFFWATKRRVSKAKMVLCKIWFCVQKSHAANEVHDRIFKPTSSPFSTALETLQKQIGYNPFSFPILASLSSTFISSIFIKKCKRENFVQSCWWSRIFENFVLFYSLMLINWS